MNRDYHREQAMIQSHRSDQAPTPEGLRVGEVADAMNALQTELSTLDAALGCLSAQLAPVLAKQGSDGYSEPEPEYRCEAGATFHRQALTVRRLSSYVNDLRSRLEV